MDVGGNRWLGKRLAPRLRADVALTVNELSQKPDGKGSAQLIDSRAVRFSLDLGADVGGKK